MLGVMDFSSETHIDPKTAKSDDLTKYTSYPTISTKLWMRFLLLRGFRKMKQF